MNKILKKGITYFLLQKLRISSFHLIQMITLLYPAKSIGFPSPHPAEEATSAEDWGDQVPA